MADFNITNFVIDRCLSATMFSPTTRDALWRLTQVEDFQISNSSEEKTAVDAQGSTVATFITSKAATMSASNSFLDLNLAAAQAGTTKEIASADSKMVVPITETFTVKGSASETITLKHVPVGDKNTEIKQIYGLNPDSSIGTKYTLGSAPSAKEFTIDATEKKITIPTGLTKGTQLIVFYEYEAEKAVSVTNSATKFPTAGELVVEVLGCDICNPSQKYTAKIIAPNALLSSNYDLSFTTDGKHPFEITCSQEYCDTEKTLYKILVDED